MDRFELVSDYQPTGDQPQAIIQLVEGLNSGLRHQTLLGATGTGKSLGFHDPVYVVRNQTAQVIPIGKLIDNLITTADTPVRIEGDTEILDADGSYYAQAFDPQTCEVALYPIRSFVRHHAPEAMYRLRTTCGRTATLTGDHNLWVLRNGCLELIRTADARNTDYIPVPERLLTEKTVERALTKLDMLSVLADKRLFVEAPQAILAFAQEQGIGTTVAALSQSGIATPYSKLSSIRHNTRGLRGRMGNSNVDVVPIDGEQLRWLRVQAGFSAATVGAMAGISRSAIQLYEQNKRAPGRTSLRIVLDKLRTSAERPSQHWLQVWEAMYNLCRLRWTPVASVEKIDYAQPYVYDLCVPGVENFLAGEGGFFVHNTFSIAEVVNAVQRPTLVMAHNKTLAAQLYAEFKEFFPRNAVEYFVSYYDYYQPEAYVPRIDLYIEKESDINEEIDRLRLAATAALMSRRDVLIVASVSCIYGLGSPATWSQSILKLTRGQLTRRDMVLRHLVTIQYDRNDMELRRGTFRVRGDTLEVTPAYGETTFRVTMFGDEVERIVEFDPITGEIIDEPETLSIFPAKHFIADKDKMRQALTDIEAELDSRLSEFRAEGKLLEAQRLEQRTRYDLEMMHEVGYCSGIENYSRHMDQRPAGSPPWTLLDYLPSDYLLVIDESHMSIPQVRGMYGGDRSRKETLIDYGFRLPCALDNRPLNFTEFEARMGQAIYTSATPGPYEGAHAQKVVQQVIRPTGIVDPQISVRPVEGQVDDLLKEINIRIKRGERVLVTTLTKRMAEELSKYLAEMTIRVHYLHSEIDTIQRIEILRDLRLGVYDVVVGINLLREGLDLPEVSLVAILDADKEGFLRSDQALIQTVGRAARHVNGQVLMYANKITDSMRRAIDETDRRRAIQVAYNTEHNIQPVSIVKQVRDLTNRVKAQVAEQKLEQAADIPIEALSMSDLYRMVSELEKAMKAAAKDLEFEKAATLRDQIVELRRVMALKQNPVMADDGIFDDDLAVEPS